MSLQDFVNKHTNQYIDYDHAYGPQCVDVDSQWEADNGWPHIGGNANQLPADADRNHYTFVRNAINNKPDPGDIVIFNFGSFGHTGICYRADYINLTCFEQAFPVATVVDHTGAAHPGTPCHLQFHGLYRGVVGWLKYH